MRTFMESGFLPPAGVVGASAGIFWSDRRVRDGLLGAGADIFNHVCHSCSDESKIPIDRIGGDWGFGELSPRKAALPMGRIWAG